jgi:hypothetical protein
LIPPGGLPAAYHNLVASDLIFLCSGESLWPFFLTDSEILRRVSSETDSPLFYACLPLSDFDIFAFWSSVKGIPLFYASFPFNFSLNFLKVSLPSSV